VSGLSLSGSPHAMLSAHARAPGKLIVAVAAGCCVGYVAYLAMTFARHGWIIDAGGNPIATDFIALWTTGQSALHGDAASSYDPHLRHAAQVIVVRHNFKGYFDWAYPPSFFFIVAALARLSYAASFLTWITLTFAYYGTTLGVIAKSRAAPVLAFAAPWTLANLLVGQNGLLTAALIGSVLLSLERRPLVSAVALAFLAYKPQFGLLFPLALAAGGYWRAFAWACVAIVVTFALSGVVFGFDIFSAFLNELPQSARALLAEGGVGWNKLQSVYGIMRWLGGADTSAWIAHAAVAICSAVAIVILWRSRADFALKAAGLCAGTLLATPYVFAYDFATLGIAYAFLHRARVFDGFEFLLIGTAVLLFLASALLAAPLVPFASVCLVVMIVRRLRSGDFDPQTISREQQSG
jgi:arabinofuranan 3-O-arabinosyltransferase